MRLCVPILVVAIGCTDPPQERSPEEGQIPIIATTQEDLRIDGNAEDLVGIAGMAVAPDGSIVITQAQDHTVRFFSSSGEPLGTVGGDGDGPREFRQPFFLSWFGDSLSVYDPGLQRMTVLDATGSFGRTVRIASRGNPGHVDLGLPPLSALQSLRMRGRNSLIAELHGLGIGGPYSGPDSIYYVETDFGGVVQRVLARLDSRREGVAVRDGAMSQSAEFPFQNVPRRHLALDGSRFLVVEGVAVGDRAGDFQVTALDASGDTIFARTYSGPTIPLTEHFADSVVDAWVTRLQDRSPALASAFRREIQFPDVMPPVLSVLNGRDGTIWVRVRHAGEGRRYSVLVETGERLGDVLTPAGVAIRVADRDHAWGIATDEFGIQSVVRFKVQWPGFRGGGA